MLTVGFMKQLGTVSSYAFLVITLISLVALRFAKARHSDILFQERVWGIIFIIAGIFFLWLLRLPLLQYGLSLNPDEALFTANAMRIRVGWLNWDTLDGGTTGPLDSLVLAWPYLLGWDVTLTTTRMTGTALVSGVCIFIFLALRRVTSTQIAILFTFPLFIFYGTTSFFDFVHYSSEHLPILLISAGIYGFTRMLDIEKNTWNNGTLGLLFVTAFVLGMVPFAKLQGAPLALLVGAVLFFRVVTLEISLRQRWQGVLVVTIGALLPALIYLIPLALTGNFHHFFNSSILQAFTYASHPLEFIEFLRLAKHNGLFWVIFLMYMSVILFSLVGYSFYWRNELLARQKWAIGLGLAALPVAYFCIVNPGRGFPHYLHFILPISVFTAGAIFSTIRLKTWVKAVIFFMAFCLIFYLSQKEMRRNVILKKQELLDGFTFKSPNLLQFVRPKLTDSLLIWGWMPQWYPSTGITPASRETATTFHQTQTLLTSYYQERLLHDVEKSKPDFILDAVASGSFAFQDPKVDSVFSFEKLGEIIKRDFVEVTKTRIGKACPRLYIRHERNEALNLSRVKIARITASGQYDEHTGPENLDDGSVWETCTDWWALPDHELGFVVLNFSKTDRIAAIEILNTRNGSEGGRASNRVKISVLNKGMVIYQDEIVLNRYPRWTTYRLTRPIEKADAVRLEILSFIGKGGGLNEVKIFRD